MNTLDTCACCEGSEAITPLAIFNRPGLAFLRRRVGEYADFYETQLSRITTQWVDIETNQAGPHGEMLVERLYPLRDLRTRTSNDLTIALLDAWAVSADVLTFYSERIANEGYLRTALELRSLVELSRLVGYRRRPGVAASVFLAFTADDAAVNASGITVPAGARVQSVPDPGQTPQTFETSRPLVTRPEWNVLTPRQARPTYLPFERAELLSKLYLQGTKTNLSPNNTLLLLFRNQPKPMLRWVEKVREDFDLDRTAVELLGGDRCDPVSPRAVKLDDLIAGLGVPPSRPPASPEHLDLTPAAAFQRASAAADGLLVRFHPEAAKFLPKARANVTATGPGQLIGIQTFLVKASVYGHIASRLFRLNPDGTIAQESEWPLVDDTLSPPPVVLMEEAAAAGGPSFLKDVIDLDTVYDSIKPGTWVAILRPTKTDAPDLQQVTARVKEVKTVSRSAYNFPAKVTRLVLDRDWLDDNDTHLIHIRSTTVYADPAPLTLADEPILDAVCGQEIELDRLVDGLQPGRWLIITGERTDIPVEGIPGAELIMLNQTRQDTLYILDGKPISTGQLPDIVRQRKLSPEQYEKLEPLPGDKAHTFLTLSSPLAYCYKRDTITIYANVAHATHGETRLEALGSGDGSKVFQTFDLKGIPPPLTYTAAIAANGVESSLNVYVNDVRWHEVDNILNLKQDSRAYLVFTNDQEKTSVMFGDGRNGARLPSAGAAGQENVRAVYRRGIGKPGNVREGQITRLVANADSMTAVSNLLPASGGASPDGTDSTRKRAPLAVGSLDRLVGVQDYADFSLLFAGIAKASAARLPTRYGHVVHVTVAGVDDIPIDATSDLYLSLLASLKRFGDPYLPIQVERRELSVLVISAKIRIHPDYVWENVKANLKIVLLSTFGFENRELGQNAYAAEAIAAMQAVPGVQYVDLDMFSAIPENASASKLVEDLANELGKQGVRERIPANLDRIDPCTQRPAPAGLIILSPDIPSTLLLTEIPNE